MVERTIPAQGGNSAEDPAARPGADSVLTRIRALMPDLPAALQRVGEQVLSAPAVVARATILETAERSGTSAATVTRFCRALDLPGYADLRLAMAEETGRSYGFVHRMLSESGVTLRGRGGATRGKKTTSA